ncbi:MAG: hypothetical protein L0Z53_24420 [Acidobacteriales bacterium]|nr:hypothetical protein [Terriglobales bacterium]
MELALHIVERFTLHLASSTSLVLALAFLLRWLKRRFRTEWLSEVPAVQLTVAALLVFAFSTLREAYDVANGQPLVKVAFDYASWLIGAGASAYGLFRWRE